MKFILKITLAALLSFSCGRVHSEYVHINHIENYLVGMFSVFSYVVGALDHFDNESYEGVKVDFETNGVYYDPKLGSNWWEYYCEPIYLGENKSGIIKKFNAYDYGKYAYFTNDLPKHEVNALIQKYIKIKPHILEKVDKFYKENFSNSFVIAVHYRGTDKIIEAPKVSYSYVIRSIKKYIKKLRRSNYKIFIATDEEDFLNAIKVKFGKKVIAYDSIRSKSNNAIHYNIDQNNAAINNYKYKSGEDAIIDCLLLSKGNILFRTSSNLSTWSTYFNPNITDVELSKRY